MLRAVGIEILRRAIVLLTLPCGFACSSAGSPPGNGASTPSTEGNEADAGDPPNSTAPLSLPEGSRAVGDVVNLVSASAATELEEYFDDQELTFITLRQGLSETVNLFLEHYAEDYDFLFVVNDRLVDRSVAGVFQAINRPAAVGGGNAINIHNGGYRSNGRLKGVIGIQYSPEYYPPLAHEVLHYWANHLDEVFGFGTTLNAFYSSHWGYSSVNGHLGGFDGDTLACAADQGVAPAECPPENNGRILFSVNASGPNANSDNLYAPLELYLMGLEPVAVVPESFQLLDEAEYVQDSYDADTRTIVLEASGVRELPFADILARHGEITPLPQGERSFRAAFVVVSASPAPDDVMETVMRWARVFGNRESVSGWNSFETMTGGLATMDTVLDPLRPSDDPVPPVRERENCDVVAQDCSEGLGCYGLNPPVCALPGTVSEGSSCSRAFECAPGFDCVAGDEKPDAPVCKPYCEREGNSPRACDTLCTAVTLTINDAEGNPLGAICLPE